MSAGVLTLTAIKRSLGLAACPCSKVGTAKDSSRSPPARWSASRHRPLLHHLDLRYQS